MFPLITRWIAFALYFGCLIILPFAIMGQNIGLYLGSCLLAFFLLAIRKNGVQRIHKTLKLKPLSPEDQPAFFHMVKEYSRRLKITPPKIQYMESPLLNLAIYGFNRHQTYFILTRGIFTLSREQQSALIARLLCEVKKGDFILETWAASYLYYFSPVEEKAARKKYYSLKQFLKSLLLYPITLIPCWLLLKSNNEEQWDLFAAKLCQNPRHLSEAMRILEAHNDRQKNHLPLHTQFLFFSQKEKQESLFHLYSVSECKKRIAKLESLTTLVHSL